MLHDGLYGSTIKNSVRHLINSMSRKIIVETTDTQRLKTDHIMLSTWINIQTKGLAKLATLLVFAQYERIYYEDSVQEEALFCTSLIEWGTSK